MLTLERNDRRLDQGRDYETVLIENIRLHGDAEQTQLRERIDEETVGRYAEALERGERFPLVELVPVGDGTYYIADGWHRVLAHKAAGRGVIDALILVVVPGADPLQTAMRYALRANLKGGFKRSSQQGLYEPIAGPGLGPRRAFSSRGSFGGGR